MIGNFQPERMVNSLVTLRHGADFRSTPFLPMYTPMDERFTGELQTSGQELAAWRFAGGPVTVNSLVRDGLD